MIELNEIIRTYPKELQKPEFYDQMLKEYIHFYMLHALYSGKYASKINFFGGTALKYFYGIKRFSEDLDFDCIDLSLEDFTSMTNQVENYLNKVNIPVIIEDKTANIKISAFRRTFVFPGLKYQLGLSQHKEAKFFIKIEAEPHHYLYSPDIKILTSFMQLIPIRTVPLEIMFASKLAAAINRKKDRDFYDVIFLSGFAKPDYNYLEIKLGIRNSSELKSALLSAAKSKNLHKRKVFDCEHMLFNSDEKSVIKNFTPYIENIEI